MFSPPGPPRTALSCCRQNISGDNSPYIFHLSHKMHLFLFIERIKEFNLTIMKFKNWNLIPELMVNRLIWDDSTYWTKWCTPTPITHTNKWTKDVGASLRHCENQLEKNNFRWLLGHHKWKSRKEIKKLIFILLQDNQWREFLIAFYVLKYASNSWKTKIYIHCLSKKHFTNICWSDCVCTECQDFWWLTV